MKALRDWFIARFSPLQQLLILGGMVRLLSVIFSKGFGWHDDHFLIIESSQSWVDGYDYNDWLPSPDAPDRQPQGHSLFYPGIHYFIFLFMKWIGFNDPQGKMMVIRLLHASWSLLVISYGYRIAENYAGKKAAWYTGIFLALFWFMPFVSVRNLVEFVLLPPVFIAIYLMQTQKRGLRDFLVAGLWLGIAFSIRFQTAFLVIGIGIALLMARTSWKSIVALALTFIIMVFLTQGVVDLVIWKRPFAEFMGYVQYNLDNATAYGHDVWHMYLDLILGLLIPPLSIVLFAGYFVAWKRTALIFWPVLIYLAFHTYFPNKQERFVLSIVPLILVSGTVGMFMIYEKIGQRIPRRLFRFSRAFVIVLNLILLPLLSVSYSKRHRVEAMYYLYKKGDVNNFFMEDSNKEDDFLMPPRFYFGKWIPLVGISKKYTPDLALEYYLSLDREKRPKYFVFWQAENINCRVDSLRKRFPGLTYEATIDPSLIDQTLYFLNPLNDNQTSYIYRLDKWPEP